MRKIIFGFLVVLVFSGSAFGKVQVEYRISRVHGLVKFAFAISGRPHESENLIELFAKSEFRDSASALGAIQDLHDVQSGLGNGLNFPDAVSNRSDGIDVASFVTIQSIFSKDLKDLSERLLGLMPMADHRRLLSALQVLDPIYEKLVWRWSDKGLRDAKTDLEKISDKADLDEMFRKTLLFYESSWPENNPFSIGLYPIIYIPTEGFRNATSSQSLGSVEEHGVMVDPKKPDGKNRGSFSVVFHELCHSVYGAQSPDVMRKWNAFFDKGSSPYRGAVKAWLNEALATAIGNGWGHKRADGSLEKKDWYNHPIIDGFAQAIYPDIAMYLDNNKTMDQALADKIIAQFARKFPDSIYEYSSAMNKVSVMTDGLVVDPSTASLTFRKSFAISHLGTTYPLNDPDSITSAKKSAYTLLVLFSEKSIKDMVALAASSSSLSEKIDLAKKMKNRNILSYMDSNARTVIFIKANSKKDFEEALKAMSTLKMDPKDPLQKY